MGRCGLKQPNRHPEDPPQNDRFGNAEPPLLSCPVANFPLAPSPLNSPPRYRNGYIHAL